MPPHILIVGGADTGRAPMAVALLQRLLTGSQLHWYVSSAGVVGHDDSPAETEARDAMQALGLDISNHQARFFTDDLAASATALITVDSGTARVIRMRYPEYAPRIMSLGELAGRQRDIPDPFRMPLAAWIGYAREIEQMLQTGLDRLIALVNGDTAPNQTPARTESPVSNPLQVNQTNGTSVDSILPTNELPQPTRAREEIVERCERLLTLMIDIPALIAWNNARQQLANELRALESVGNMPDEPKQSYVALLQTALTTPAHPTGEQLNLLRTAFRRLNTAIDQSALNALSDDLRNWPAP